MLSDALSQCNEIAPRREFEDTYGGFVLSYRPQPTPDGRFMAYVIVSCDLGFLQTCAAVTPDVSSFASAPQAAQAGCRAGRQWVDIQAQRDASARRATRTGKTQPCVKTLKAAGASLSRQPA